MNRLQRIKAAKQRKSETKKTNGKNQFFFPYPHLDFGDKAVLRLLEDGDVNNDDIFVESTYYRLTFQGSVNMPDGVDTDDTITVNIPCSNIYTGKWDKLSTVTHNLRKDNDGTLPEGIEFVPAYLYQCFVIDIPYEEENVPENPIRICNFKSQVHEQINSYFEDDSLEASPTDTVGGKLFELRKTRKRQFAQYTTSRFTTDHDLTKEQIAAIEKYGLFNLSEHRMPKPDRTQLQACISMVKAAVNGEPYDYDLWGWAYVPYGVEKAVDKVEEPKRETGSTLHLNKGSTLKSIREVIDRRREELNDDVNDVLDDEIPY